MALLSHWLHSRTVGLPALFVFLRHRLLLLSESFCLNLLSAWLTRMLPSAFMVTAFMVTMATSALDDNFLGCSPLELLSGKEKRRKRLMGGWMWTHMYWRDRGRKQADNCHKEGRCQAFSSSLSDNVARS